MFRIIKWLIQSHIDAEDLGAFLRRRESIIDFVVLAFLSWLDHVLVSAPLPLNCKSYCWMLKCAEGCISPYPCLHQWESRVNWDCSPEGPGVLALFLVFQTPVQGKKCDSEGNVLSKVCKFHALSGYNSKTQLLVFLIDSIQCVLAVFSLES